MKIKIQAYFYPIISIFLCNNLLASEERSTLEVSNLFRQIIGRFAQNEGTPLFEPAQESPKILKGTLRDKDVFFYGIEKDQQSGINFRQLKKEISQRMGLHNEKLVQLIGDCIPYSKEGTQFFRKFLEPYFEGNYIIEYGFTGSKTLDNDGLDVNFFLKEYIDKNPAQANKVLANIVGHSVIALEQWKCECPSNVSHYVVVYNKHGMEEGFTKFGDDVIASDYIQSSQNGDILLLMEGGPQSFKQSVNILKHDIPIKAVYNIRTPERRAFFSAAEFFCQVKEALIKNPDLSPQEVQAALATYLKSHKTWDPEKPDADTKEKLFYSSVEEFINPKIYKKLLDKVEIIDAANGFDKKS